MREILKGAIQCIFLHNIRPSMHRAELVRDTLEALALELLVPATYLPPDYRLFGSMEQVLAERGFTS